MSECGLSENEVGETKVEDSGFAGRISSSELDETSGGISSSRVWTFTWETETGIIVDCEFEGCSESSEPEDDSNGGMSSSMDF